MKMSVLVGAFFFTTSLFAQTRTVTITELAAGTYSLSSSEGIQVVNVLPLGGGAYSFYSTGANSTIMPIAPGAYTVTSSVDGVIGTTYVQSLGNGSYSFSNPVTGETGSIQVIPAPAPPQIPLPALAVRAPDNNNLLFLAAMAYQQCQARGGVMYKAHWYSTVRCVPRAQAQAEETAKIQKKLEKRLVK